MSPQRRDPPAHVRALDQRIRNLAGRDATEGRVQPELRLRRAVANTVVRQMVPEGVIKGGTAMKLRIGEAGSRFTPDFDAARSRMLEIDDYLDALEQRLEDGWGGFTGRLIELVAPEPEGVPGDYVVRPFDIKLAYQGRSWLTVRFELGHDEIGSTADPEIVMSEQMRETFAILGLPDPQPVAVLPVPHQIAQKLHACTSLTRGGTNERAHDLVDLQLLVRETAIDNAQVADTARRLFAARQSHPWPPTIENHPGWDTLYAAAADGLDVLPTADEAVAWANDLVARIDAAT